jgi:ABC-2 type transport system ATP-binding protein
VAQGSKAELLAAAGTLVRTADADLLARALHEASVVTTPIDGGLRVDADPELVGATAHRAGVVLRELRPADGAGLEEMFLELTAETAREGAAA